MRSNNVVELAKRIEWRDRLLREGKLIPISTVSEALAWGRGWQRHAERLEMLLEIARINARASELLAEFAEQELQRIRGIVGTERTQG